MYVIRRSEQDGGGYVARDGSGHSYTRRLELARKFSTREDADGNRCPENEFVICVDDLLRNRNGND